LDKTLQTIQLELYPHDNQRLASICGLYDEHLHLIERRLSVTLRNRGHAFEIIGESPNVKQASELLQHLYQETVNGQSLNPESIQLFLQSHKLPKPSQETSMPEYENRQPHDPKPSKKPLKAKHHAAKPEEDHRCKPKHHVNGPADNHRRKTKHRPEESHRHTSKSHKNSHHPLLPQQESGIITTRHHIVKAHGPHQQQYVDNIRSHPINFAIGPSGTGKTYLAVACAVSALERHEVNRIILVRPAVEAGEKLGFLPGDMQQKVDPYLRPLYDGLFDLLGIEHAAKLVERNIIEVAPLAYMRGRTLNEAFIILDEAQNSTPIQMKMFLTRLGFGSTIVVTGDTTQTDLRGHKFSGLEHAMKVLTQVHNVCFTYFDAEDVVRHPLVQAVVEAYDNYEHESKKRDS